MKSFIADKVAKSAWKTQLAFAMPATSVPAGMEIGDRDLERRVSKDFFKTCEVHYCYSADLGEPRPKKCRCKKVVSREMASTLVQIGEADWIIDSATGIPTWHVVLRGRTGKTPRANTIESAHMERYTEHSQNPAEAGDESIALLDEYHDTVIEARLKFFRVVAADLLALKKRSDAQGTMEGTAALITDASVIREADDIKLRGIMKDPFAGRALIVLYTDYRSSIGITVKL